MPKVKSGAFYMLTIIFVVYLFDYADRKVISALFTSIEEDWNVTNAQLEMLNGIVSLVIAIFVIPLSIIVDRWSRVKMISIMVFVWSLATLMCAFAENYTQLLIFRGLTGFGEAAYAAAAIALITKHFPSRHRAKHIGIYDAAAPIGSGVGIIAGGLIGAKYGWQAAFGWLAVPGLILSILVLFIKDYHTIRIQTQSSVSLIRSVMQDALYLFKIPTLQYLYLAYGFVITVNTTMIDFLPKYLEITYLIPKEKSGLLSGGLAVGVLFGAILGGVIADMWEKQNKHAKIYVSIISTILSIICLLLALNSTDLWTALTFFALFGLNTVAFLAPVSTMIQQVVKTRVRALAFGFNVLIMNFFVFIFSVLIGYISDFKGLTFALSLLSIFGICAIFLFYGARNSYHRDKSAVME